MGAQYPAPQTQQIPQGEQGKETPQPQDNGQEQKGVPSGESHETLPPDGRDYFFVTTVDKGTINGKPNVRLIYYDRNRKKIVERPSSKPINGAEPLPDWLRDDPKI